MNAARVARRAVVATHRALGSATNHLSKNRIVVMSIRFASVLVIAMCCTGCGGGYSSPTAPVTAPTPAPVGSTTVSISNGASTQTTNAFGQNPLTISVGTTISWVNNDNTTHTSAADG